MEPVLTRALEYAGVGIDTEQWTQLLTYRDWLISEALPAGGIGPREADRVESRHVADSLVFAAFLPSDADQVWDLGSGVGLPGIPLAICRPQTEFRLIDRSGRRVNLLKRAVRILGLTNCVVVESDVERLEGSSGAIVARAFWPAPRLSGVAERHLARPGRFVMGGSWRSPPTHAGWETIEIPPVVLDQRVWLLIMRRE